MKEETLKKFLSNKCSYKECESIVRYFQAHEEQLDDIDLFENISENEMVIASSHQKQASLEAIFPPKKGWFTLYTILRAAVLLIIAAFPFYKAGLYDTPSNNNNNLRISLSNEGLSSAWYILPDSSRIKLEPQAKVVYYANFASQRMVQQIRGEATYYVHSDKQHPFSVNKNGIQTTALGTIFNITDYSEKELKITLLEGKIGINSQNDGTNQQVFLNDHGTLIIDKNSFQYRQLIPEKNNFKNAWEAEKKNSVTSHSASTIAWSNKVVNFKGVTNADLFSIMERLYAVTIDVENPAIINGNFTGDLKQNDNIEDLLMIFCQINACRFSIDKDIITIR